MSTSFTSTYQQVVASPTQFFRLMPRSGELSRAIIFVALAGVFGALLMAAVQLFSAGFGAAISSLVKGVVVLPVYSLVLWAVLSALYYVVWKIFGSGQSLETASYCTAYSLALFPVWLLARDLHIVAQLAVILWAVVLLVIASEVVHGIARVKAVIAFSVLAILALWWRCCDCDKADEVAVAPVDQQEQIENKVAADSEPEEVSAVEEIVEQPESIENNQLSLTDAGSDKATDVAADDGGADASPDDANAVEFSLTPEEAGQALGELVRDVTETVTEVGEDFKRGFEAATAPAEETAVFEQAATSVEATVEAVSEEEADAVETPVEAAQADEDKSADAATGASNETLTPAQLGELLGQFIRQIDGAAKQAQAGFDAGMQSDAAQGEAADSKPEASEQAGRALGEFVRAFSDAIEGLETSETDSAPANESAPTTSE